MTCSIAFAAFIVLITCGIQLCTTPEAVATNYQPKSGAAAYSTSTNASRSRAKRFLFAKFQHTSNGTSTFQIERKLLTCGDISPNPGPETTRSKPKYPCGECARTVRNNQDAVLCARCNVWSDAKCLQLSKSSFKYYLQNPEIEWTCSLCSLPNFSDSFFNDNDSNVSLGSEDNMDSTTDLFAVDDAQMDIRQLRDNNRKQCIIANLNINSLPNKFAEIKEWLISNAFDILSVQETKIDRSFPNTQFHVDGYNLFRRDRVKGGGGIAVYIRDTIVASRKKQIGKRLESILFDLRIGHRQFALISAYKPPSVDNTTFTSELISLLDEATRVSENVICIGDLNCDIMNPSQNKMNKQGKCLLDICDIYDLDSLITSPTRISTNKASCLDVILTNVPAFIKDSGIIETGLSDHSLIYAVLNTKLMCPKAENITKRTFKNFDQKAFLRDLNSVPFSVAYVFDDPDDVYWCWDELYNHVLDDHAPVITTKKRPSTGSKFITTDIRKAMRERDRLKKKFHKPRNLVNWENYRLMRNRVVSMRRRAVQGYFKRLCEDKYADQKQFWSTIKPYINSRKCKHSGRIVLKDNEKIIRDQKEVVELKH